MQVLIRGAHERCPRANANPSQERLWAIAFWACWFVSRVRRTSRLRSSSTFRSPSRHANRRSCLEHVLDFAASTALHCLGGTYVDHMCGRSRPAQSKASVQGVPSLCPKTEQAPRRAFSSYKARSMPQGKTRAPCQFLASLSSQIGWICPHGTIYLSYFPPPSRHQLIL
jgi:hypothetical protein